MSLTMYAVAIPMLTQVLRNLRGVLAKGGDALTARNVADDTILGSRLILDMLPLSKQVQIACDMACRGAARLAGETPRSFEDSEKSVPELLARIDAALAYIQTFKPEQFAGAETREITIKAGGQDRSFDGLSYLQNFVLPNLLFHATMSYALLRQAGVPLGKQDFLGAA